METANVVEILREAGPGGMHVKDILTNILDLLPKSVDPKIPTALNVTHLSLYCSLYPIGVMADRLHAGVPRSYTASACDDALFT